MPSIANRSLGRRFEAIAFLLCRARGYSVIQKNRWLRFGEIDLWVRDRFGCYRIIEVRGRRDGVFRPVEMLSAKKIRRLRALAMAESRRQKKTVRLEFLEIIAKPEGLHYWLGLWAWRYLGIPMRVDYRWFRLD